ncbi:nucleoporin Nup85-like protein [Choanephora cucurbitarum]|nr:nucleoporin Nup85-like protein [Choanephora cucurbitarum]
MSDTNSTHASDLDDKISNVDLLSQKLNDLQTKNLTKEQLYRDSFKTFNKINNLIRSHAVFDHADHRENIEAIAEYSDKVHDCLETVHLEPIWELAESLYFPLYPHSTAADLAGELSGWLDQYYPLPEEDDDWICTIRHLLRGNTAMALNGLESIKQESQQPELDRMLGPLIQLIEQYNSLSATNTTGYIDTWQQWQEACQTHYQKFLDICQTNEVDVDNDSIYWCHRIYQTLIGEEMNQLDDDVLLMEQLVAILLYSRPYLKPANLQYTAQQIESRENDDELLTIADYLLKGLLDDALDSSDDLWLQTHLGQALIASGAYPIHHLKSTTAEDGVALDPVFYCIQQYAHWVADTYGMWTEAFVYLTFCQENQALWIQQLLGKDEAHLSIPWEYVDKVLSLAIEYNLKPVEQFVYRAIGKHEEAQENRRQATVAYGKAQDWTSVDRLAEAALEGYRKTGQLDSVVMDMESLHQSQSYSFLIRYQQLKDTMAQKAWEEAAQLLWALLKDEHIPPKYSIVLLIDNRPILKDPKHHFYQLDQLVEWIRLFNQIKLDTTAFSFIQHYYNMTQQTQLTTEIILAQLREQLAFKAATAPC